VDATEAWMAFVQDNEERPLALTAQAGGASRDAQALTRPG
jgi:hypothetical protein